MTPSWIIEVGPKFNENDFIRERFDTERRGKDRGGGNIKKEAEIETMHLNQDHLE